MSSQKAPRYQGKITSWKDDQGYGFITPNGGGAAVFVHVSAFSHRGIRPVLNEVVTYHLGMGEKGPRAEQVAFVRGPAPPAGAAGGPARALIVAAAFLGFVGLCVIAGRLPLVFFGVYAAASVFAFLAYAADKSAAQNNSWRISERTLHMLGLVGGWPGALFAQQVLRHKSKKTSFRTLFWATVVINCVALAWFLTPAGARVLQQIATTL